MRRLLIGGVLGVVIISLAACSSASGTETTEETQRQADYWEIDQIEKNFHQATTLKDIDLMMSLWAPSATLTAGPGDRGRHRRDPAILARGLCRLQTGDRMDL